MTAPEQPYPDMTAAIGVGAYAVSGGTSTDSYGSTLTTTAIDNITEGAYATSVTDGASALTKLSSYTSTLPSEALPLFGAAFGLSGPEVSDVMTFITNTFNKQSSTAPTVSDVITRLSTDLPALCDWLHDTYQEGASTDAPGALGTNGLITTWGAWNDLMELLGFASGVTTPTTPLPGVGAAVTGAVTDSSNAIANWTTLFTDLGFSVTTASSFAMWLQSLSTDIGDALAGNITPLLQLLFGSGTSSIPSSGTPLAVSAIPTGIPQNNISGLVSGLASLLGTSVFQSLLDGISNVMGHSGTGHTVTQVETYLGLIPPANVTNVLGGSNLGADVTAVHTTATSINTWLGEWMAYSRIVFGDPFYAIYPEGSPTDTPTTTIGGVPTWYSAWNGMLALEGLVKATTAPTQAAPTTGAAITTAQSAASAASTLAQGTIDGINTATTGVATTGNPVTTVATNLVAIPAGNIIGATGAAVAFGAAGAGNAAAFLGGSPESITWSHDIATGDLIVVVGLGYMLEAGETATSAVSYGSTSGTASTGTPMTLVQREISSLSASYSMAVAEVWELKLPPSGSKTIAATLSGGGFNGIVGDSASYSASKIGTVGSTTGGGSATLAMTAASVAGNMVFGMFAAVISSSTPVLSGAFAGTGQSQRYNNHATGIGFAMGDAPGAASIAFGATSSVPSGYSAGSVQFSGITVELTN